MANNLTTVNGVFRINREMIHLIIGEIQTFATPLFVAEMIPIHLFPLQSNATKL